jgi:hypothetical protein
VAITGIGVKDVASHIFVEDAEARQIFDGGVGHPIVVIDFAARDFLRPERDVVVVIEISSVRRHPANCQPMKIRS